MRIEEATQGMKQRISSHLRAGRYVMILIAMPIFCALVYSLFKDEIETNFVGGSLVALLVAGILYYLFDQAKTVEFDYEFMYVTYKSKTEKVPLGKVFTIKMTMTQINNRNMWKIKYVDNFGKKRSVRILPKIYQDDFQKFKVKVKSANSNVEIQNWSHSFDFDQ